jgi:hypothetical protein
MLADIMSALYSALNTALVAHELLCDREAIDALAAEHIAEVSIIFKNERLIFTGGRSGGARSRNGRGASGRGGEGALVPRGWMEAAGAHPLPQPLLMRVPDCIWGESVAGAVLGLFPLRSVFASMRPFFVQVLGVAVPSLPLSFRALLALADLPWPLVQDRLALIAGSQPQSKPISSNFEASLALFREIEDLLTNSTFNQPSLLNTAAGLSDAGVGAREVGIAGQIDHSNIERKGVHGEYSRGCDGCLSDSARERGDGRKYASQVLRVKYTLVCTCA